jgi:hypothetical protein
MKNILLLNLAMLLSSAALAHDNASSAPKKAPPPMQFACADFEHLSDGNWRGKTNAKATMGKAKFDFSETVLRPGEVLIDGLDMKTRLDAQCGNRKSNTQ